MKKERLISIDPYDWLNHFAIWTMRYCIHRNTYASDCWVTILSIIESNPEIFRKNELLFAQLKFFAGDIRTEISQLISMVDGIDVVGNNVSSIKTDAYTLLTHFIEQSPDISFENYDFRIDCTREEVIPTVKRKYKRDHNTFHPFPMDSYGGWIKLANSIDKRYLVTVSNDEIGKEETAVCVEIPSTVDRKTMEVTTVLSPVTGNYLEYYLPEFIKSKVFIGTNEK